ncbi:MAG TPA: cardiolipin synthase, partial [Ruminococcus sp.]|nr:cardiolipin synthase [Ruminococcus sp.]
MKKFLSKIFSRLVFTVFLMLVQVAVLVLGVWKLNEKFYFVYGLLTLLDIILVIYINNRDDNPSYKLSWIMLISVIPVFGGLTYLYLKIQFSRKIFIKAQERSTEYGNNY